MEHRGAIRPSDSVNNNPRRPVVEGDRKKEDGHGRPPEVLSAVAALQRYDRLYKIIVIGDQSVGKSNLTIRFCDNQFGPQYIATIGIDFKVRTIEVEGKIIKLQIWDTAGQERFQTITRVYYRGTQGVLFVYDVTDRFSFEHIRNWIRTFDEVTGCEVQKIIVGNKCDKYDDRQVQYHEGVELADSYNCRFIETSAKTGYNVENAFHVLSKSVWEHQNAASTQGRDEDIRRLRLSKTKSKGRNGGRPKKKSVFSKCKLL